MAVAMIQEAAQSQNTRIAYEKGWRCFTKYCERREIVPHHAAPEEVAEFFTELGDPANGAGRRNRGLSLNTLRIYRSALNRHYASMGRVSPAASQLVGDILQGLGRLRQEPPRRVKALRDYHIVEMLGECSDSRYGRRDGAMLALGFAAALRRSELCALRVDDIERVRDDRVVVRIRRSKTDQEGSGQTVAVPDGKLIKPVTRLNTWLSEAGIREGYLFQTFLIGGTPSGRALSDSEVPRLVKKYAAKIGLDPKEYSGHSLRAGFVTSAAAHRARLDKIMEVTRHRNPATLLSYMRDADAFKNHAGDGFL